MHFALTSPCPDLKENKFPTLAFAAEADAIVSGDEDLLMLDPWGEVRVFRASEFLEELSQR